MVVRLLTEQIWIHIGSSFVCDSLTLVLLYTRFAYLSIGFLKNVDISRTSRYNNIEVIGVTFSDRLKYFRTQKGYTQQQIADLLEIQKATYSGYETGRREPDVFKIKALARILGVTGDDLLDTGYQHDVVLSAHARRVAKAYDAQPDMQPAVDRILGLDKKDPAPADAEQVDIKMAAHGGGGWEGKLSTVESAQFEDRLANIPDDISENNG